LQNSASFKRWHHAHRAFGDKGNGNPGPEQEVTRGGRWTGPLLALGGDLPLQTLDAAGKRVPVVKRQGRLIGTWGIRETTR